MQYIMTTDKFDIDIIEQTLEKYYNGASTLAEEQMLLEYFTSTSEIPNKFHNDRDIFIAIKEATNDTTQIPKNLEDDIINMIDRLAIKEKHQIFKRNLFIRVASIAASLLIISAVAWNIFKPANAPQEITSPELAYAETVRALTLVSTNLNKANGGIITTNNAINNINNDLNSLLK